MLLKAMLTLVSISLAGQSPLVRTASGVAPFWKTPIVVAGGNVFDLGEVRGDRMVSFQVNFQNTTSRPIALRLDPDAFRVAAAYVIPPTGGTVIEGGAWQTLEIQADPKALIAGELRVAIPTDVGVIPIVIKGHCELPIRTTMSPGAVESSPITVEFRMGPNCGKVVRWWFEGATPLVVTPVVADANRWQSTVALPAEIPVTAPRRGCNRLYIETEDGSVTFTTIPWKVKAQ